jgi:hypothetical protein
VAVVATVTVTVGVTVLVTGGPSVRTTSKLFDPLVWYLSSAAIHGNGYGVGKRIPHVPDLGNSYGNGFGFGYAQSKGFGRGYGRHWGHGAGSGYGNGFAGGAYGNGLVSYTELNHGLLF